jgi:2'-5' RNA ligase
MKKVYTSALVVIPPKELWPSIQEIRMKYDRQIKRWMPHITLLYPFIPETEFDLIIENIFDVCEKISPFKVNLKEFDVFHHEKRNYTFWLKPQPMELVVRLQDLLLRVVPECNDVNRYKGGFVPHLSLGQINDKNKIKPLLENMSKKWNQLSFFVNQIHFISRKPFRDSKFEIKKSLSFGKLISSTEGLNP